MSRPPDETPRQILVPADDADSWNAFLSETSSELQILRTELHAQAPVTPPSASGEHHPLEGLWKSAPEPPFGPSSFDAEAPAFPIEPESRALVAQRAPRQIASPGGHRERLALPPAVTESAAVGDASTFPSEAPDQPEAVPARAAALAAAPASGELRALRGPAQDAAGGISLAHLLAQRVPVNWTEAVATIEELCAVLVHQAPSASVPTLQQIVITPSGEVHVVPGSQGRRDTAAVGRLLHTLLAQTATPLPLRLFVTSTITSPRYESIELYADALADYALPNRSELIGALCRRALETPAIPRGAVSVPRALRSTDARPSPGGASPRRRWVWMASALCVSFAGAAGLWFGSSVYSPAAAVRGELPPPLVTSEPTWPVASEWAAPLDHDPWALGAIGPFEAEPLAVARVRGESSSRAPAADPIEAGNATPAPILPGLTEVPTGQSPPRPTVPVAAVIVGAGTAAGVVPPRPSTASAPAVVPPATGAQPPARIYTAADADVQPPILAAGQPRPLPPSLPSAAPRMVVELLIDERGVVQSATVVGRPQRWDEMMMLSSLKNQRYHPATRDGAPVPYRLRIQP